MNGPVQALSRRALRSRFVVALTVATVFLALGPLGGSAPADHGPYSYLLPPRGGPECGGFRQTDTTQSADVQEAVMLCLHNYARRKAGRAPLTSAPKLVTSSGRKAIDLRECSNSLRNSDPHNCGPGGAFYRVQQAGYCYRSVSENVFWGWASADRSTPSPREAMDWWLNSSGHRDNLLRSTFTQAGFGLAKGRLTGVSYPYGRSWVAHFGRPCG